MKIFESSLHITLGNYPGLSSCIKPDNPLVLRGLCRKSTLMSWPRDNPLVPASISLGLRTRASGLRTRASWSPQLWLRSFRRYAPPLRSATAAPTTRLSCSGPRRSCYDLVKSRLHSWIITSATPLSWIILDNLLALVHYPIHNLKLSV